MEAEKTTTERLHLMEVEARQLAESVALMVGNLQTNLHAVSGHE